MTIITTADVTSYIENSNITETQYIVQVGAKRYVVEIITSDKRASGSINLVTKETKKGEASLKFISSVLALTLGEAKALANKIISNL